MQEYNDSLEYSDSDKLSDDVFDEILEEIEKETNISVEAIYKNCNTINATGQKMYKENLLNQISVCIGNNEKVTPIGVLIYFYKKLEKEYPNDRDVYGFLNEENERKDLKNNK